MRAPAALLVMLLAAPLHAQGAGTPKAANTALAPVPVRPEDTFRAVPHGTIHIGWYHAAAMAMDRRVLVYTPPGYETGHQHYPVLYLLHGSGGDEEAWLDNGRAGFILDNLVAAGRIVPMIVVMPNGNASQAAAAHVSDVPIDYKLNRATTAPDTVVPDLIPYIDRTYRTRRDARDRAIAGLSMGGAQTFWIAFHHIELFEWVGTFSAAFYLLPGSTVPLVGPRTPPPTLDPAAFRAALPELNEANARLKLLYLTVGDKDFVLPSERTAIKTLDAMGVRHAGGEIPGYAHEWPFWRLALIDFATRLFK